MTWLRNEFWLKERAAQQVPAPGEHLATLPASESQHRLPLWSIIMGFLERRGFLEGILRSTELAGGSTSLCLPSFYPGLRFLSRHRALLSLHHFLLVPPCSWWKAYHEIYKPTEVSRGAAQSILLLNPERLRLSTGQM